MIVPAGAAGAEGVPPGTPVAGLPLLRRIVLAAAHAGFGRILVHPAAVPDGRGLLAGTAAVVLAPEGPLPALPPGRIVLLAANVIPQSAWLHSLLEMPLEPERFYTDGRGAAVIETGDPDAIVAEAARRPGPEALLESLGAVFKPVDCSLAGEGRFALTGVGGVRQAEDWLLRGLVREAEGFMSRHVERRISLALTRRLVSTRISPNIMTFVSLAVGLAGAPFFLSAWPLYQLTGALLLLAHSILDGCDGELARLKFEESRLGSLLDFWGDNVVHVAVMACIAIGWSLAVQAAWPLLLGGVAAASVLLAAGAVYRLTVRQQALAGRMFPAEPGAPGAWLPRLADVLARRDFIYLVVLLSAAGKATWFLALAAVGTPLFLLALAWITRRELRRRAVPV
ncbi:MAG: CDP-alcohol phosphatidyltransferase family protein [Candidatus Rokubacteria bacterium]|nr:CDP-alcohol phosphatidyltransferase family protein [Candidatus Rokubacteria bacterium]